MKKLAAATVISLAATGALTIVATDATARPGHHHHRGGARVGVVVGAGIVGASILASPYAYSRPHYYSRPYYYEPYGYPYYGYAPAYYPPVAPVIVQQQPIVYIEQPAANAAASAPPVGSAPQVQAQAQQQYWYFCQDSQTYYPHAQTCASPWQRVVPHAPQ